MKSGALLGILGTLGVAGYFGYDYWKTEKAKQQAELDAKQALKDRNGRTIETIPSGSSDRHAPTIAMPDLAGLTPDEAKEALVKAGFKLDKFKALENSECTYKNEHDMKPKGHICSQEPAPKSMAVPTARIEVVLEEDTYEEGGLGSPSAWKRMPKLEGLTETAALSMLRSKGFAAEEFDVRREQGCGTVGLVCHTNPEGDQRKIRGRVGAIVIGD